MAVAFGTALQTDSEATVQKYDKMTQSCGHYFEVIGQNQPNTVSY